MKSYVTISYLVSISTNVLHSPFKTEHWGILLLTSNSCYSLGSLFKSIVIHDNRKETVNLSMILTHRDSFVKKCYLYPQYCVPAHTGVTKHQVTKMLGQMQWSQSTSQLWKSVSSNLGPIHQISEFSYVYCTFNNLFWMEINHC